MATQLEVFRFVHHAHAATADLAKRSDTYIHKRTITVRFFVSHSGRRFCEERGMMLSMELIVPSKGRIPFSYAFEERIKSS